MNNKQIWLPEERQYLLYLDRISSNIDVIVKHCQYQKVRTQLQFDFLKKECETSKLGITLLIKDATAQGERI